MRRNDRNITDIVKIEEIIKGSDCCRGGFYDGNEVYIVPLNFGYELKNNDLTFYFHGAKEGRKIDLIKTNPKVGFELDTSYKLKTGDFACAYSAYYQSVIGNGIMGIVSDVEEKKHGLSLLMEHSTNKKDWEYTDAMLDRVEVFKLNVFKFTAKENKEVL